MLPYIICYILILLIPFIKDKRYSYFSLIVLSFFMGVRDMIGSRDVYNYAYHYEALNISEYVRIDTSLIGFKAYNIFLKLISSDRYFFFFITSFTLIFLQSFAVKEMNLRKIGHWILFMVLCKFYLFDFVYLRQMMAMGIAWIAFSYYFHKQDKWLSFIIFLIAATFHRSAFILIPLFFVLKIKINLKFVIGCYLSLIILLFSNIIPHVAKYFMNIISDNFSILYKLKAYYPSENLAFKYLLEIPLVLVVLYFIPKLKNINALQQRILFNAVFLYGFFSIFSMQNTTFIRFAWFYFLGLASAIVLILNYFNRSEIKNYIKIGILVYYSAIFFRILISFDGGDFIPYKSIFNEFKRNGQFEIYEYRQ
ncbi:EpsG family protein [Ornithobacterium rhinotracheale]|uniref:EpsG family protein n=1 Tax=Ornithobacterium rhinotracheale TaxID=28251 RepID=UPI001FF2C2E3|nr:EpsG family protein [Ornithobacterium rhinotracheale]MCK0205075.1 EpsG family protein [Ornithobacterium rhinotracheale]